MPPIEISDKILLLLLHCFHQFCGTPLHCNTMLCFSNVLFCFFNITIRFNSNNELVNTKPDNHRKWLLLPVVELNPSYLAMTLLTNTFESECLLLFPRMPRRILQGFTSCSLKLYLPPSENYLFHPPFMFNTITSCKFMNYEHVHFFFNFEHCTIAC